MEPSGKKVTLKAMFLDMSSALEEMLLTRPRAWLEDAKVRLRDLPKTNFDLGYRFSEQNKLYDAVFRFRIVLFLNPDYPNAWFNLGSCYFRMGKPKEATEPLREALKRDPSNTHAKFMLAAIAPELFPADQRPTQMPRDMVVPFFAGVAAQYDITEANVGYQAGGAIHELAKPLAAATPRVLDLGCGTGIAARPWRSAATEIVGVDFTSEMIALADKATHADKKLFDVLVEADIAALPETLGTYDLILAVNVTQFIGDLSGFMQSTAAHAASQAIIVVTLEPYDGRGGFGLNASSGRFGHSIAYVRDLAQRYGLMLEKDASLELYRGTPQPVLIFRKA